MAFRNPILGGTTLLRAAIASPNYTAGSAGWSINRDGSAEFNNVTVRGVVFVKDLNGNYVKIWVNGAGSATSEFGTALSGQNFNWSSSISSWSGTGVTARQGFWVSGPVTATNSTDATWGALMSMVSGYGNNNIVAQQPYWDFYFARHLTGPDSINFLHLSPTACQYVGDADAIDPTTTGNADTVVMETWKTATLTNGWSASTGGGPRPGCLYKKLSTGLVAVDGCIQKTTGVVNGEQIGSVPAGYLPPESRFWTVGMDVALSGSLQFAMLEVQSTGAVYYFGPNVANGTTARIFVTGQWPLKD